MKKTVLMLIVSFALGGVSFAQAGTADYNSGSGSGNNVDSMKPDANAYPTPGKTMQQKMERPSDMNQKQNRSEEWKKNQKHHRPSSELNDNINGAGADTEH